ncbi:MULTISPECIES: ABC transporter substrate-binding protein [unclassified Shinella]|uniref:ABC transporter substrate-binding protein n=1 Tax=unclassified Shinella TaxID=2643062 RepID=UPI00234F269D|nr:MULTISPECIES: ABC transporter substrate-binding protein [unclassified Shinella]MCO5148501.1 ABC transporter substrate-binding protein [Shinella sp.]MDC7264574.1 ABC transporter substrate-binding protein [Shinella sp. HY16]MDC7271471.1 ABC transporter substrate-binding protein [Shinella sp. YZ44]
MRFERRIEEEFPALPLPVIGEPTDLHAKQFETLTGAEVDVVHIPFGDLYQRIMIPFQTQQAAYDVLFYPSLWIGDLHDFLAPVPPSYKEVSGMKDVTANYKDVATWGDKMVQYPVDGDRHYMKYRSDIFDNPDMQAKFRVETGKELRVPQTWEEYNAVAKFFSGWDWAGDGQPHFGSAEVTKRDDLMFSAFISRVAAYAKNPSVKGGFFFDLETMEPQVNNPGWVKGLEMFIDAQKAFPPGGGNFRLGDEIFSFGGGQTLMSYSWDDAFIQAQEADSPIRNKVGAAPLPGAHEVWNRTTGSWDKFETPNAPPYITWGWTSAVAKASKNQDMAFDYLCFFSNEANTTLDLQIGRFGVNPYRTTHFDPKFWQDRLGWDQKVAETYVQTLSGMDDSTNRVFDLRVPGVNQFMSSLANGVAEAMAGQKSAQEALDGVAAQWKEIRDKIGTDHLREAYANVVALEDRGR